MSLASQLVILTRYAGLTSMVYLPSHRYREVLNFKRVEMCEGPVETNFSCEIYEMLLPIHQT